MIDFELKHDQGVGEHGFGRDRRGNDSPCQLYKAHCLAFAKSLPSFCPTLCRVSLLVPESMEMRFRGSKSERYFYSRCTSGEMLFDGLDMLDDPAWRHAINASGEFISPSVT
jgi:hypothetical protein